MCILYHIVLVCFDLCIFVGFFLSENKLDTLEASLKVILPYQVIHRKEPGNLDPKTKTY